MASARVITPSVVAWAYYGIADKAFRHGDIEEILPKLVKNLGSSGGGGGDSWLVFMASLFSFGSGGKFTKMDMKRIYFVSLCLMFDAFGVSVPHVTDAFPPVRDTG